MEATLPENLGSIVLVFDSECSPTFSHEIDVPDAIYLGVGDPHDSQFDDDLEQKSTSSELQNLDGTYTGVLLDSTHCPMTITAYPSIAFRDKYVTSAATLALLLTLFVFAVTTVVFVIFNVFVERRQRLVSATTLESTREMHEVKAQSAADMVKWEKEFNKYLSHEVSSRQFVHLQF